MACAPKCKSLTWWLEIIIPILVALPFLFKLIYVDKNRPNAGPCLGVTIITAAYWIFEPIPIVITGFFPIFLLPIFCVSTATAIASSMFTDTSMVFIGGFIFSIAMVKWNLHSRIALKTVCIFGLRPNILLLGICLVTTLLSFWISNTACALTMVPNTLAIINKLEEITGDPDGIAPFGKALLLMVAMTCSTAGMITLIGTPPNLILAQSVRNLFPDAGDIGFAQFIFVSLPVSAAMLVFLYLFFIVFYMRKVQLPPNIDIAEFKTNYEKLGKMKIQEIFIIIMFVILACLWLFRSDIDFGSFTLKGWSTLVFGTKGANYIKDGTIAIALSMLFYIIRLPANPEQEENDVDLELRARPTGNRRSPLDVGDDSSEDNLEEDLTERPEENIEPGVEEDGNQKKWEPLLDWEYTQQKMPWTILFLFAGGFALNQGFKDSTLDTWVGSKLSSLTNMPLFALLLCITFITSILSNIASNTACANILIPIVATLARTSGKYHPWLLMVPTAFATSCCFIMPVATPPNLICFGSGRLETKDFMIAGTFINVVSLFIVVGMSLALVPSVLGADGFPSWAALPSTTSATS